MRKTHWLLLPALVFFAITACVAEHEGGKAKDSGAARVELRKQGIIIDAKYNRELDNLIPGYKIVTVGLSNNGVDLLKLNPLRDRWDITDATGQVRRGANSLRIRDPETWSRLPSQVKELIEYPVAVQMGYSETIDLFFPNNLDLTAFRSISFYSAERKETYDILAMDDSREVPIQPEAAPHPAKIAAETPPAKHNHKK
jgi:hypothetical protein